MPSNLPPPPIHQAFRSMLSRRQETSTYRSLVTAPPGITDCSSNDFLSFSKSSDHHAAFLQELSSQLTTQLLGSTGSRLLDGSSTYAEDLERDIAAFHGGPAGLLFNSGYSANLSFFSCVPQPDDVIIHDQLIHASVHDGMRLGRTRSWYSFAHNSVDDFRRVLQEQLARYSPSIRNGSRNVFVAVESVYSMDGDCAPLKELVRILEDMLPAGNGYLVVDEAHATGVLGPQGRGLVCELGLESKVFALLHTFGKALTCDGAIIICDSLTREYLINYARPMIYTGFLSFHCLAAIRVGYRFLQEGKSQPLTVHVFHLVNIFYALLENLLATISAPTLLSVTKRYPLTPIISLLTPHPRGLAKYCQDGGFMVRAIMPPTVPPDSKRVRICLHAGNTVHEVERLVERIREWTSMMQSPQGQRESEQDSVKIAKEKL